MELQKRMMMKKCEEHVDQVFSKKVGLKKHLS